MNQLVMKPTIKVLPFILAMILLSQCEKDEPGDQVKIRDQNFLSALIQRGVDTNGDSIISYTEAETITFLNVGGKGIFDMTGIEAFINLDTLLCFNNHLSTLDVSHNKGLTLLGCWNNLITTLDVSKNPELTELGCNYNQLTSLDLTNSPSLIELGCNSNKLATLDVSNNNRLKYLNILHNQLKTLDVSNNDSLIVLQCSDNQLASLDISNNTLLKGLMIENMPMLYTVCVWTTPFPPAGVLVYTSGSPNVDFTIDCSK